MSHAVGFLRFTLNGLSLSCVWCDTHVLKFAHITGNHHSSHEKNATSITTPRLGLRCRTQDSCTGVRSLWRCLSAGRERDWSYELTSATATGGLICQFVACYELCAIATQRSGRRSKWLQPQKCSALTRAAQSDQAWNESTRGEKGSES